MIVLLSGQAWAGLLSGQGAFVLDPSGAQRSTFSNNERVVLQQRIFNSVASGNRISFKFVLVSPNGTEVFTHQGNMVPGTVGNAASQVSGVPVSQFYTGPGFYTLRAEAELDGQVLTQQAQFSVSSPNILLIYPPNGARDLADNPLTFRWSASGASRYRVQVGDNPSLYNALFSQDTLGSENFLGYPQNPSDPRQRLATGQVYYWKVEGLDSAGNVIAQSEAPFNYSVQATSLAKDLAVADLAVEGAIGSDGKLDLRARVANQGNTTENSVNLKISVGGLPAAGTPIAISLLNPGESREFTVQAYIPADQKQTLATACLELFDDNVPNNCRTLSVTKPEGLSATPTPAGAPLLSADQLWEMLQQLLKERGIDVTDWLPEGSLDSGQLSKLIDGLRQGTVQVTLTGAQAPPPTTTTVAVGQVTAPKKTGPDFGGGGLEVAPESEAEKRTPEQVWLELDGVLKGLGVDLAVWEPAVKLSAEQLDKIVKGLKAGTMQAVLTGPAAPEVTRALVGKVEEKKRDLIALENERALALEPEAEETLEWSGMGPPAGRAVQAVAIKDADEWSKTWKRLQEGGQAPKIDFKKNVVVGIVGGSADRVERIELEGIQLGTEGLVVRYRFVGSDVGLAGGTTLKTRVPFLLKQIQASPGLDVRFERVGAQ